MRLKKRFRPCLESLESRLTPSVTTRFSGGLLSVVQATDTSTQVALTATGSNSLSLSVNGSNIGTFSGVSAVQVQLGNAAGDSITLDVAGNTLASRAQFSVGRGAGDTMTVESTTGANGSLAGTLNASFGAGAGDNFFAGDGTNSFFFLAPVSVSGSSTPGISFTSRHGDHINASATLSNINNLADSAGNVSTGSIFVSNGSFAGTATISWASTLNGSFTYTGGSGTNSSVTIAATATIGGNFGYSSPGPDAITLAGTVNGNATLSFGSNANTYSLTNAFTVGGSMSITAGNSTNAIALGNGTAGHIGGSLTVNLGDGIANTLMTANGFTIGGNLNYLGGSGGNAITLGGGTSGSIAGGVNVTLGNGANSFTENNGFVVGGGFSYRGGNSSDSVTLGGGASGSIGGNVSINMGNGTASFTENAGFTILGTNVSYNGGTGTNTVTVANTGPAFNLTVVLQSSISGTDTVDLSGSTNLNNIFVEFGTTGGKLWVPPPPGTYTSLTLENYP